VAAARGAAQGRSRPAPRPDTLASTAPHTLNRSRAMALTMLFAPAQAQAQAPAAAAPQSGLSSPPWARCNRVVTAVLGSRTWPAQARTARAAMQQVKPRQPQVRPARRRAASS